MEGWHLFPPLHTNSFIILVGLRNCKVWESLFYSVLIGKVVQSLDFFASSVLHLFQLSYIVGKKCEVNKEHSLGPRRLVILPRDAIPQGTEIQLNCGQFCCWWPLACPAKKFGVILFGQDGKLTKSGLVYFPHRWSGIWTQILWLWVPALYGLEQAGSVMGRNKFCLRRPLKQAWYLQKERPRKKDEHKAG